jgi:hypothetical protein
LYPEWDHKQKPRYQCGLDVLAESGIAMDKLGIKIAIEWQIRRANSQHFPINVFIWFAFGPAVMAADVRYASHPPFR